MIFKTLRARMLAATVLPVTLVVLVLVGTFVVNRVADLRATHQQRSQLLAQQVALASEYGLFSGNLSSLQGVAEAVQREVGVHTVAVLDPQGKVLARAGRSDIDQILPSDDVVMLPITTTRVALDDLYDAQQTGPAWDTPLLGYAVVEVSSDVLHAQENFAVGFAIVSGLLVIVMGGLLAMRMGASVLSPMQRVTKRVERIGEGDFAEPQDVQPDDPLADLHTKLNAMASSLSAGREELEQRVDAVTQALRQKKEEAENATLAKSHFLAAASHDMRQPTHALGMFVARLGQLPMDDAMRPLVNSLEVSVQAMQNLLDGLLDLSRLDSGAVKVDVGPVCLADVLGAVETALMSTALAKGIRFRVRPTSLWGASDPVLLQRMVMNLTHNALRYTEQGTVFVTCRRVGQGSQVRIEVWDSGIGISTQHQTEIFKEFYQVGNPGHERTHGLGLGLNIVERSAQLLKHSLALRSETGCGSRFSITMPLAQPAPALVLPAPPAEVPVVQELAGLRVLVIEDDEFALIAVQGLLESWGCRVLAASSVGQALAFLLFDPMPHVIVSDYRLADGENGIDAIAAVRQRAGYDIPACLMSGDTDAVLVQCAKEAALTLLHKPVRPAKLRSLVRHLAALPQHPTHPSELR
jgi:two-component system, sensor histidine kinase